MKYLSPACPVTKPHSSVPILHGHTARSTTGQKQARGGSPPSFLDWLIGFAPGVSQRLFILSFESGWVAVGGSGFGVWSWGDWIFLEQGPPGGSAWCETPSIWGWLVGRWRSRGQGWDTSARYPSSWSVIAGQ